MHILFVSYQSYQTFLRYDQKSLWPWKKQHIWIEIVPQSFQVSNIIFPKANQVISMTRGNKTVKFCCDLMSGSHVFVQTGSLLLINVTVVTLGQGHGKFIQYIFSDPYILCPKYVKVSTNGADMRGKVKTNWKHKVTPDRVIWLGYIQYIPRNMHTVFALLCFVVVIHWLILPYPSGLLHWHCGNLTIAPVPAKQPWWKRINTSCEFIMNDCITTTKQSTTKPCAYFLGYTVCSQV